MKKALRKILYHLKFRSRDSDFAKIRRLANDKNPVMCNLGCGSRIHNDWINIDFHGDGERIFSWDLGRGLPFLDKSCDVLYSSHAIEHFDRNGARKFLKECRRVLKPNGIIRLAAPDLEGLVRAYLSALDAVKNGEAGASDQYEWIIIELLDQLVRHKSGGEMLKYWCQEFVPAEEFVASRVGTEYWRTRSHCKGRIIAEKFLDANDVGKFRLGGEVHQWMYDSYSLGKLLTDCGFVKARNCRASESAIERFHKFNLDTEPDGSVYKPDSFFIEANAP
jgi:predicted SAM-dependent methyltransferase